MNNLQFPGNVPLLGQQPVVVIQAQLTEDERQRLREMVREVIREELAALKPKEEPIVEEEEPEQSIVDRAKELFHEWNSEVVRNGLNPSYLTRSWSDVHPSFKKMFYEKARQEELAVLSKPIPQESYICEQCGFEKGVE